MVDGLAIGAAALGAAGRRRLPGEMSGPRPAGTAAGAAERERRQAAARAEDRVATPTRP